ncbi:EAL domain-containing protein [Rhodococcoides corynebacterioides]|uniref:EAL domain-containing protein n=1 Tax=Rhodococcoides corynebacterioides TaxID=53972 RepID=A0ABS7P893_9NOCA|nr:GGDEF domain-containing phosphodiesterase [Rhodococcus corynebacterioides]MBY6368640.1 EAL domain-containing protein [Rhodococcus corynebacterioides]MBY6409643.1 EAL domain-containing protein [Rhodococcus corynebacterioides]
MISQRISPDPVLSFLVMTPKPAERSRLIIALVTVLVGVSGLTLLPSSALRPGGDVVVAVAAATTVPVAAVWLTGRRPAWFETAFVVYATVGVVAVLAMYSSPFHAMPSCSALVLISLYATAFTRPRIMAAHVAVSMAVLLTFAAVALAGDDDGWIVLTHLLSVAALFASPFVMRYYVSFLRRQVDESQRDPVTGLLTRRGLYNRVTALARTVPAVRAVGVVTAEIAATAELEKRYGHAVVDDVVIELAERLTASSPDDAVVSRLDADHLLSVFPAPEERAATAARHVADAVTTTPLRSAPADVRVGSIVEPFTAGEDPGTFLHRTLSRAQAALRDRTAPPGPGGDVHRAVSTLIADGGPRIVFQPVCRTADLAVVGYEALSRFPDGSGSPVAWFADAETVGLRVQLEMAAVTNALRASAALPPGAFLSINASSATLVSSELAAALTAHLPVRRLVLEITEHDRIEDYASVRASIAALRSAGVVVSVDDVGSGYSGLRQLVELEPAVVKLDASIVRGIDTDPMRRAAAVSIVTFTREIGAQCVFEGVETEAELAVAAEVGADLVQGYLLGRPAPPPTG